MTKSELFESWLQKNLKKEDKINKLNSVKSSLKKAYNHLDSPISVLSGNNQRLIKELQDSETVRKRSFYPFLKMIMETPRFQKSAEGKRIKHIEGPKQREIYYAAHKDSLFYAWYSYILNYHYEICLKERKIENCIIAYRSIKKQTTIHFANSVFKQISNYDKCAVLAFDVSKFFDNLDHKILKDKWCEILKENKLPFDHFTIFKSLTKFKFVEANLIKDIFPLGLNDRKGTKKYCLPEDFRNFVLPFQQQNDKIVGIPQGSPMSAVLANVYMLDFDTMLNQYAFDHNGYYRRYSDDILLIVPIEKVNEAEEYVKTILKKIVELPLNEKKTETRFFYKQNNGSLLCTDKNDRKAQLQYLGLEFDGIDVRVRSASWARYHQKIRKAIRRTFAVAKGKNSKSDKVFKRKLYKRFTSLSNKSNFIKYVQRVHKITGSLAVRNQYKNHLHYLQKAVKRADAVYIKAKSASVLP